MQRTTQQRPVGIQLPAQQPHLGVSLVKIASEPCNHVNARDNVLVEGRVSMRKICCLRVLSPPARMRLFKGVA